MSKPECPPAAQDAPLLSRDEPPAVEVVNAGGRAAFLLVCDHASRRVPQALDNLGLDDALMRRHIAWDIGAAEVAHGLAQHFDAPLRATGYSRLVIDCNRSLDDPSSIPEVSDGVAVPGNRGLSSAEIERRQEALFRPYHRAIAAALARFRERGQVPALVSIHSFTPVFDGVERPWHVGILWDQDPRIAIPLIEALGRQAGLVVGDNQPYSAREPRGYTVTAHAHPEGYPHVAIEIRQDLIDTHHGAAEWTGRLAQALAPILAAPAIYRAERRK